MLKTFFSKISTFFSGSKPKRETYALGTGYTAPYSGGYGSGDKYAQGMSSGALINIHDHLTLRQRSRDAMYDSTEARGIVESFANSVVETGLRLKPVPNHKMLGITPESAEEWAEDVAERFHMWAKSKDSDVTGVNNFYQNQRLYEIWQQRDNDMFVRFNYSKSKNVLNPLQIGFFDPNQIRGCAYTSSYVNMPGNDGIIRDKNGKEIGFKVWQYDPITGEYKDSIIPAFGEKSGRRFMLHGYSPEYAGQGRGYPRISHILQDLEKLTDFKVATIVKAINQASINFVTENDEKDPSNPLEGLPAGPVRKYGESEQNQTALSVETEAPINYTSMPEATMTKPGVNVFKLRRGDRWKGSPETGQAQVFDTFKKSFLSSIVSSTGLSYEFVEKQFGTSYSANQGNILLCYRVAQVWREEMNSDFNDPVYESWLSEEIASGRIKAPGWSDPRLRAAWLCAEWSGAPMINIDRVKSANADRMYTELGAQTLDDVARNFNGSSGKANRMKLKRQYSEWPAAPWNAPAPAAEPIEPDEDDKEEMEDEDE